MRSQPPARFGQAAALLNGRNVAPISVAKEYKTNFMHKNCIKYKTDK